jgi:glucoamylase
VRLSGSLLSMLAGLVLVGYAAPGPDLEMRAAPGAPGAVPTWSNAEKVGIGSSYEAYDEAGQYSEASPTAPISKVWFSLGEDRITEVIWGLIHEAQIREIRYILVGPEGVLVPERSEAHLLTEDIDGINRPTAAHMLNQYFEGGETRLALVAYTDPENQTLVSTFQLDSDRDDLRVFAYIDPALANTGTGDRAWVDGAHLYAQDGDTFLSVGGDLKLNVGNSVGFVGATDIVADLLEGVTYQTTGDVSGNVEMLVEMPFLLDSPRGGILYFGFGESAERARAAVDATRARGVATVLEDYKAGWRDYIGSLEHLPDLAAVAEDGGALAYMSAINLKIMEDKTHAGALIASLSNPWGETAPAIEPQTGYKAVWPRDFFQVASAFVAMGDAETALAAYRYLPTVQVSDETPGNAGVTGWFLQKTHVDGTLEWVAIQQDQTAMPIMLGWKFWDAGLISDREMAESYRTMLKPAADFLVEGGRPNLLWNTEFEASLGYTQQERWEEQEGYSPSTVAAVIAGLVTASELAERFGDPADAERYLAAADELEANLEAWMFTTNGVLGDGEYFIRITRNQDPNDGVSLGDNNGRPGLPETHIVDGGFLELVRYGVRAWDAPSILASLEEIDGAHEDNLRVRYAFDDEHVGWRRYGNDGYGEDGERGTNYHEIDGGNTPGQRGRVWPFFSGERGHYEIARLDVLDDRLGSRHPDLVAAEATIRRLISSMEAFANAGLSLPEQVWDNVGPNPFRYEFGEGTNSATPLAWTHAEYVKLLRSFADRQVWDQYPIVEDRYRSGEETLALD